MRKRQFLEYSSISYMRIHLMKRFSFLEFMLDEFEFLVKEMQASDILFQQELQSKQSYCFSEVGEVKMLQFRFLANVEMPYSQLNPGQ